MGLIPWGTKRQEETHGLLTGEFRNEIDRLFDSFMRDVGGWDRPWGLARSGELPVDVEETDTEISVRAEIPGVKAEDLRLSLSGESLVINGEKKEAEEKREKGYFYQERRFGAFRREVLLPAAVNQDAVEAEYKDGVLHVTLKKSQEALPRRIAINTK